MLASTISARGGVQQCVCWCISPCCPPATADTAVVSGPLLQGDAQTSDAQTASWDGGEGLLLLLLQCLKPVSVAQVAPVGITLLYTASYSRGPHPFCAQQGKLVPAQCQRCCGKLQMHAEEHWKALGPSRLTQTKDSFFFFLRMPLIPSSTFGV